MTELEERVEAARVAVCELMGHNDEACSSGDAWYIVAAAFPELLCEPPTAWLAPWEATREMQKAARYADAVETSNGDAGCVGLLAEEGPEEIWNAMRDAHLHSNRSGE